MKDYTDIRLVELLQEGDSSAFEEMYKRYWFKLYCIAFRHLGVKEECEELVQNVFLSVWNRRKNVQINKLDVYLTVSIKNQIYDFIKSQISYRKYQEYVILQEVVQSSMPFQTLHYSELSEAVEAALARLPEKSAEVFRRSRFHNQSVKKIAEDLNLSDKTVEYHITKSLKFLKESLWMYNSKN
jgi:RNA polymerase sigma-70 factor (family 1)